MLPIILLWYGRSGDWKSLLSDMSKAGVSFDRVDYILGSQEEGYQKEPSPEAFVKHVDRGGKLWKSYDISFSHVDFQYEDGKKVLDDVSFHIPQGATFGILGGTGSGKSTIVQLLERFYSLKDQRSSITIGGKDIREIPLEQLRRNIGMVLQEPFLYSRTIRENIAASRPDATMEEIREAARIACVDDAIMSFPDGYETLVGERGVTLSGGQRQRVAIARMLLQKAPIMVFDDSLSAVDSETDHKIPSGSEGVYEEYYSNPNLSSYHDTYGGFSDFGSESGKNGRNGNPSGADRKKRDLPAGL